MDRVARRRQRGRARPPNLDPRARVRAFDPPLLVPRPCAIRHHEIFQRSLAAFLLIGPPSTFKTTIARALIVLIGGDPDADLVNLPGQTGNDLLIRRGARGEEVSRSRFLALVAAAYDELGNTRDPLVRPALEHVLMHGELNVSLGNDTYVVPVTPIVIMNPLAGAEEPFCAQTGLQEATERRTIVVDFRGLELPPIDQDWLGAWPGISSKVVAWVSVPDAMIGVVGRTPCAGASRSGSRASCSSRRTSGRA